MVGWVNGGMGQHTRRLCRRLVCLDSRLRVVWGSAGRGNARCGKGLSFAFGVVLDSWDGMRDGVTDRYNSQAFSFSPFCSAWRAVKASLNAWGKNMEAYSSQL